LHEERDSRDERSLLREPGRLTCAREGYAQNGRDQGGQTAQRSAGWQAYPSETHPQSAITHPAIRAGFRLMPSHTAEHPTRLANMYSTMSKISMRGAKLDSKMNALWRAHTVQSQPSQSEGSRPSPTQHRATRMRSTTRPSHSHARHARHVTQVTHITALAWEVQLVWLGKHFQAPSRALLIICAPFLRSCMDDTCVHNMAYYDFRKMYWGAHIPSSKLDGGLPGPLIAIRAACTMS
jgi:hypothetical protein